MAELHRQWHPLMQEFVAMTRDHLGPVGRVGIPGDDAGRLAATHGHEVADDSFRHFLELRARQDQAIDARHCLERRDLLAEPPGHGIESLAERLKLVIGLDPNPRQQVAGRELACRHRQLLHRDQAPPNHVEAQQTNQDQDQEQCRDKYAGEVRARAQRIRRRLAGDDVERRRVEIASKEQLPHRREMRVRTVMPFDEFLGNPRRR